MRRTAVHHTRPANGRGARYEILVNGHVRWRGANPQRSFQVLTQRYPKASLAIRWIPDKDILIAYQTTAVSH